MPLGRRQRGRCRQPDSAAVSLKLMSYGERLPHKLQTLPAPSILMPMCLSGLLTSWSSDVLLAAFCSAQMALHSLCCLHSTGPELLRESLQVRPAKSCVCHLQASLLTGKAVLYLSSCGLPQSVLWDHRAECRAQPMAWTQASSLLHPCPQSLSPSPCS